MQESGLLEAESRRDLALEQVISIKEKFEKSALEIKQLQQSLTREKESVKVQKRAEEQARSSSETLEGQLNVLSNKLAVVTLSGMYLTCLTCLC